MTDYTHQRAEAEQEITEAIENEFIKNGYERGSVTIEYLSDSDITDGFIYLTGNGWGSKPEYLDADAHIIRLTSNSADLTTDQMKEIVTKIPALTESVISFIGASA